MRVLLRLGAVQLAEAVLGQHLGQRLCHLLLLEDDRAVEVVAVTGHRRQVEAGLEQALRELARAVRPEVEEDHRVAGLDPGAAGEMRGLDELVRDACVVLRLHVGDGVDRRAGLAGDDRVVGALGALPALVAVHRVVAAGDARDPLGGELGEVVDGRVRRDVAAVGEGVDPRFFRREAEQCAQVVDVRVDAAVRDEAEQVDVPATLEGAAQHRILEERAVLDRRGSRASGPGRGSGPTRSSDGRPRSSPSGRAAGRPPRRRPSAACAGTRPRSGRRPACRPGRRRCRGRAAHSPTRRG